MTTELSKFNDAYSTMVVASYEPLFMQWVSSYNISAMANMMAYRLPITQKFDQRLGIPLAGQLDAVGNEGKLKLPSTKQMEQFKASENAAEFPGVSDAIKTPEKVRIKGFPSAVSVGGSIFLDGIRSVFFDREKNQGNISGKAAGNDGQAIPLTQVRAQNNARSSRPMLKDQATIPVVRRKGHGTLPDDFDLKSKKAALTQDMLGVVSDWLKQEKQQDLDVVMQDKFANTAYFFWPGQLQQALSPIGISHFYRQLFFNTTEGYGPIEQCFTVAPAETLEVIYETVRKQSFEEITELGQESVSDRAVEQKNLDEVSDKAASMLQNDASVAISADFGAQTPVYSFGAEASANFATSSQRNRERTTKNLKQLTTRASERISKSYAIKTRSFDETTSTSTTRRLIANPGDTPVNYGLRRVLRKVQVKVQDLGPRLVWQLYLTNPGEGLAKSRFVHFKQSSDIAVPNIPPGVPPMPEGGTDSGNSSSVLSYDGVRQEYYVRLVITVPGDRIVTAVSIDSITDLEGGGKNDLAPSPANDIQWNSGFDEESNTYTTNIAVLPGDAASVSVNYTYAWDPSEQIMAAWENQRLQAYDAAVEEQLQAQFERQKVLITEQSKIKPRAAKALRQEERYEVMNRMITHMFAQPSNPSEPSPLELESFHKFFDVNGIFTYMHPSWWKPRFAISNSGLTREAYPITAESEPAPLGSSLGWMIQLDGDDRRNEFLNSPWVRVCVPIKPEMERRAVRWLAKYIEGERGYDENSGLLKNLLEDIEKRRDSERSVSDGPDYAVVSADPGAPDAGLKPSDVYPIIDEFDVTVPTEGFIYDKLEIAND